MLTSTTWPHRPILVKTARAGKKKIRRVAALALVLGLCGIAVIYQRSSARAVHDYDSGPVRTNSDTTTSIAAELGQVVTFGGIILENVGSHPAVLESIRIEPPLDSAMSLVDVKVAGRGRGIGMVGADIGFPPADMPAEALMALPGAVVPAGDTEWGLEVLMGFKLIRPGQFGFHHVVIDYRVADKRHRVRVNDGFFLCGPLRDYQNCDTESVAEED